MNCDSCDQKDLIVAELQQKLKEAEKSLDLFRQKYFDAEKSNDAWHIKYQSLSDRLERMELALKKFGKHLNNPACQTYFFSKRPCDCGLDEALQPTPKEEKR